MRKKKGSPPSYTLHKPSGQAVIQIRQDGRRRMIYLGLYGSEESIKKYQEFLHSGASSTLQELGNKFIEWANEYYRLPNGSPSREINNYQDAIRDMVKAVGTTPAEAFTKESLVLTRNTMVSRGLCRSTINARIRKIQRIFKWAATRNLVSDDVALSLRLIEPLKRFRSMARESDPVKPVDQATVEKTLQLLNKVVRDMVQVQYHCGMRPGEVCRLTPRLIKTEGSVWVADFGICHKTAHHGHKRKVYMGPKTQEILKKWLKWEEPDLPIFRPYYITRRGGMEYDPRSYNHAICRACKKAGVEAWFPNQLRHSFATKVRSVYGLDGAQVALGHKNANVTEIYAEVDDQLGSRIARDLG